VHELSALAAQHVIRMKTRTTHLIFGLGGFPPPIRE